MHHRSDHSHFPADYRAADQSHLRVSDAERSDVSDRLSRHFADGRLDQAEFAARLERATGAKTRGDLAGLFDDLPRLADDPPPRRRRHHLVSLLLVVVLLLAVVDAAGHVTAHVSWVLLLALGVFAWLRSTRRRPPPHGDR